MNHEKNSVACPNCGHDLYVSDIFYQVEKDLAQKFKDDLEQQRAVLTEQLTAVEEEKRKLATEANCQRSLIDAEIRKGLKRQAITLKQSILAEVEEEKGAAIASLEQEVKRKSKKLKEFNKAQSEIERLKRENDELADSIEAKLEKKHSLELANEKARLRRAAEQASEMKIKEREKIISQLTDQLRDAHRQAEQGSVQLQGEVQELAIESWLSTHFPLDTVDEVKKGAKGADCLQTVNTQSRQNCGRILFESKRTKHFQESWIQKFKSDMQDANADIGVLVTEAMPRDMDRMGLRDGVWICSLEEFRGLSLVLRENVIRVSSAIASQENKGEKMTLLYNFLTGNEFRLQIEAIVEGFTQLHIELQSEKRAMNGIWKRREKQIDKVLMNTNFMYSSVKGIAGDSVQPIALLELPVGEGELA